MDFDRIVHSFAGNPLDRIAAVRPDEVRMAELPAAPGTRIAAFATATAQAPDEMAACGKFIDLRSLAVQGLIDRHDYGHVTATRTGGHARSASYCCSGLLAMCAFRRAWGPSRIASQAEGCLGFCILTMV
jgi:hypothetical protein